MPLSLYNSLSRRVEPFRPLDPERVTVYACGPTVYSHVHIGNWSLFTVADIFVRWLRESGYAVTYVQNITDVEDKIIRDSRAAGESRETFTGRWTDAYLDGMRTLGSLDQVDHFPRATAYVDGMVDMIQSLLDKGHAYLADDGSIYYRVSSFETYGKLANLKQDALRAGASGRISADEYEKEEVGDFALWKAYVEEDGEVFWEPTFTIDGEKRVVKGRPGWHIECSVMSTALLGPRIDVHLGGEDLLFPHHQNEIAQSEAALGEAPFVGYWLHHKHLLVDGSKMSKSKGNFHTLKDLIDRYDPSIAAAFRYLIASGHYRKSLDFSFQGLEAADTTLRNLRDARGRLEKAAASAPPSDFAAAYEQRFSEAMDDDLQSPEALGAIHEMVRETNRRAQGGTLRPEDAASALEVLAMADRVFGLFFAEGEKEVTEAQQAMIDARAKARSDKQWAEADRLRDALAAEGIVVKDSRDGQEISFS